MFYYRFFTQFPIICQYQILIFYNVNRIQFDQSDDKKDKNSATNRFGSRTIMINTKC